MAAMADLKLSVLDQSPIRAGGTGAEAIAETMELARHCDRLGYHRYWLAEHHNSPALAGSSPEVLIASIAGQTENMRIGAGGVMLNHYTPLKVAETFRTLEALYPGRIDLGLGRAVGGDALVAAAFKKAPGALGIEHYPDQLHHLLVLLDEDGDTDAAALHAAPGGTASPPVWLLGSSAQSATIAGELGLPFSFGHFIDRRGGEAAMATYRATFTPSARLSAPRASIAVFVICAESQNKAEFLALSREAYLATRRTARPGAFQDPRKLAETRFTPPQQRLIAYHRKGAIVGTPGFVRERLEALAHDHGADEVLAVTITFDFEARLRSYELLAEAF